MNSEINTDAFIFMKVGDHANETWDTILERKNREYREAGMIFWGYGGTACHPLTQVQPFVRDQSRNGSPVHLLMEPIDSDADPDVLPATEYSADGVEWKPIPKGVSVTGSRYAMVLDEILPGELDLDADEFAVGIGPSRGKRASKYLQGRVDKACLERRSSMVEGVGKRPERVHAVRYRARLIEPYAVLLK